MGLLATGPAHTDSDTPTPETEALFLRGFELHKRGKLAEAEQLYAEVTRRDPQAAEAVHFLGLIAIQAGRPGEAVDLITRAIALRGDVAAMHSNRAVALAALGRLPEAADDYATAAMLQPDLVQAHVGLGDALNGQARYDEALVAYDQAIALQPGNANAHMGLGNVQRGLGRFDDALASYDRAVALNPASPAAFYNRGNLLVLLRRLDAAIASFGAVLDLQPSFALAHHACAVARLQDGQFETGFAEYEWRKQCADFQDARYALTPVPTPGTDLSGKILFVYPERFLGDMIQFCRYVRAAESGGAKVVLAAREALHGLLRSLSPTVELLPETATPAQFDYACALMSLPLAFGATAETCAPPGPYLSAEPARVQRWKSRVGEEGFKIGVCWQGSTLAYSAALKRSFPLAALQGVGRLPGVRLISLQQHDGLDQLTDLPAGLVVETLGEDFDAGPDAFLDAAAVIASCDLVITADTSIAHLAGALGARTWVALPFQAEWRWMLDRDDCPWYPTLRLFRQKAPDNWRGVFAGIETALAKERTDHA
jgi:tetratricopeptide (TPR) repeat protein